MKKRKQDDLERLTAEMLAGTVKIVYGMVDELYANGTVDKWKIEKKLKETKRVMRKTEHKLREQRIINECLEEIEAGKSA
jgi:hypothetical protein